MLLYKSIRKINKVLYSHYLCCITKQAYHNLDDTPVLICTLVVSSPVSI